MHADSATAGRVDLRRVWSTWWPLAGSWVLMGIELPAVSAVMARLANPEINLAAYGGIIFPLALVIEAPVIMLLAASTSLSRDWDSYVLLRRFMLILATALTLLHALVAFTPLYDVVVGQILGTPEEIREPARAGLMILTPWTAAIAYRRFQQGVLIRFGHSRAVGLGTVARLVSNVLVLIAGYLIGSIPGATLAATGVAVGVISEALYVARRTRPVVRKQLRPAPPVAEPLTVRSLLAFYVPLAITPIISLLNLPIASAAMSRMPRAIDSLAVWPVISGLTFSLRSLGIAYNEVVVALVDRPGAVSVLRRFTPILAFSTSTLLLIIAASPLSRLWFAGVTGLSPELVSLGRSAIWIALLGPALSVFQSTFQGVLVHVRLTRAITEAMTIFLLTITAVLTVGIVADRWTGIYVGLAANVCGQLAMTVWLGYRSRDARQVLAARSDA